jgi:DNA repair exonuclease SbcCD ATPase subunit
MKTVILSSLNIANFKGIEKLNLTFDEKIQNIRGKNGSGKTSIFDSFTWLLFGKNSSYESDFEIKPIDEKTKQVKNRLDTTVDGVFIIDGTKVIFKRVYREKWTKKRGAEQEELTGHETDCFIDEVPTTISDFKTYISNIIDEDKFKTLLFVASESLWFMHG